MHILEILPCDFLLLDLQPPGSCWSDLSFQIKHDQILNQNRMQQTLCSSNMICDEHVKLKQEFDWHWHYLFFMWNNIWENINQNNCSLSLSYILPFNKQTIYLWELCWWAYLILLNNNYVADLINYTFCNIRSKYKLLNNVFAMPATLTATLYY